MPLISITLDGSNTEHTIANNYTLTAPGIVGNAGVPAKGSNQRGDGEVAALPGLDAALALTKTDIEQTIRLEINRDDGTSTASPMRSADESFILRTPLIGSNVGQAVLYTDEASGVSQWIFPESVDTSAARRGGAAVTYVLPREAASEEQGERRGVITKSLRKIVRVVSWWTDELLGSTIESFVAGWEAKRRPEGWQTLPLTNREPVDLNALRGGRALLLIHGTFSTAEAAFGTLPQATVGTLRSYYADRVIAFNHPTMATSPSANVDRILATLPPDLELDIVTHSRGGLVGRELVRRAAAGAPLQVGKIVLVASPNRGTPIADSDHWLDMLDRYTSLLANLPDTTATVIMEGVLTLAKIIAHAGVKKLEGLKSMTPGNDFLQQLNRAPSSATRTFALVADYCPNDPAWIARFVKHQGDKLIDSFFGEANDGVVPTAGGYTVGDNQPGWSIPAAQRVSFPTTDQINHSGFFAHPTVGKHLLEWLDPRN